MKKHKFIKKNKKNRVSRGKNAVKFKPSAPEKRKNARRGKSGAGRLSIAAGQDVMTGKIDGTGKNYAFFVPDDGSGDLFIAGSRLHGAIDGDRVKAVPISRSVGAGEGEVVEITASPNTFFTGAVHGGEVRPDLRGLPGSVKISGAHIRYADGDKVYAEFTDKGASPECVIVEKLGLEGNTDAEVLSVIRSYRIEERFPPEVIREAENLEDIAGSGKESGREDFTADAVITIDGAHSKDFDDAVCVKKLPGGGYRLYVHIADVTAYVAAGSAIDKTAFNRGTSVYFADRVIPMLPEKLSNDLCSLVPGKERPVLSCIMDFNADGERVGSRIAAGTIKSAARTTYDEIYAYMTGEENSRRKFAHLSGMLDAATELYRLLRRRRINNGSVEFEFVETEIEVDEKGEVTDVHAAERNDAHRLIEEFMLAANATVAATFSELKVPFVYRVHASPPPDKISALIELLTPLGMRLSDNPKPPEVAELIKNTPEKYRSLVNMATLRSMSKAEYKTSDDGHFGLNFTDYCHFTSPIRRYPDLAIHRIIKSRLAGETKLKEKYAAFVKEVASTSSEAERRAEEAERKVDDVLVAKFMSKKIGEIFPAKITGVTEWGVFAALPSGVEGCIRVEKLEGGVYKFDEKNYSLTCGSRRYRLGDDITVRVDDVSGDRIDFSVCDAAEN